MGDSCTLWRWRHRRVDPWATVDDLLEEPVEELLAMLVSRVRDFDARAWEPYRDDSTRKIPTTMLVAITLLRIGDLIEEARERRERQESDR